MEKEPSDTDSSSFVMMAAAFEFSLAIVAVLVGWLFSINPFQALTWRDPDELLRGVVGGVLAAVPLLLVLIWARQRNWLAIQQLRRLLEQQLLVHFRHASWADFALISLAAGFGEEVLFRGCLQQALALAIDPSGVSAWLPVIITSLFFGLVHCVSRIYFVLASLVGLYFGILLMLTGSLWIPLVAHAVYDFVALWLLHRDYVKKNERPDP